MGLARAHHERMRNSIRVLLGATVLAVAVAGGLVPGRPSAGPAPAATPRTGATPHPGSSSPSPPPSLVLVLTDDQTADSLPVMENVGRLLADRGVTFTRAFATTPLCCPSRASILTGRYSSHTGVYDNRFPRGGARAFDDTSTLATWLQAAGYETSLVGKYMNEYGVGRADVRPGWTDWHGLLLRRADSYYGYELNSNGRTARFGRRPEDYLTTVLASRAVDFIERASAPFFLTFAPYAPHAPAEPEGRDRTAFADAPPHRPPSFDRAVHGGPAGLLPRLSGRDIGNIDRHRRRALASLLSVDRAVARIVDALERRELLENTVIVFTSDNGHLFGEHRIYFKTWPYEESVRVPLVVRGPGFGPRRTDDRLVANIDIASTFAELARVTPGLPQDGRSLVPLLRGERTSWRDDLRLEFLGDRDGPEIPPRYDAIRTSRYKLIVWEDRSRELYDLVEDPYELTNLAGRRDSADVERTLLDRLLESLRGERS
jgi:N-acetylglucosamine-6-sulfatase